MESPESLPLYQYQPLGESSDSIRLLLLEPGPYQNAVLRGSLVTRSLSSFEDDLNTHYAALSYVWGDPSRTKSIELVDGSERFRHGLTANLHEALMNIREESRAIWIWADAICINQHNTYERGRQVKLMGSIYRTAGCTVIYLGPLSPEIKCVFDAILQRPETGQAKKLKRAAKDLSSREWFNRGWVFQELVLSRNPRVQVGRHRISWSQMYSTVHRELPATGPGDMVRIMDTAHNDQGSCTFSQLVVARKGTLVSDPRDYFFCLMGIASDAVAVQGIIPIDYSQGVKDVLAEVAKYMVKSIGLAAVFNHVDEVTRQTGLPSFVPTWGITGLQSIFHNGTLESAYLGGTELRIARNALVHRVGDGLSSVSTLSEIIPWGTQFMRLFSKNLESRTGRTTVVVLLEEPEAPWKWFRELISQCDWRPVIKSGRKEPSEDPSENNVFKTIFSVIEDTGRELQHHHDGITKDKVSGYRWTYSDDLIALVPAETTYGDLVVHLRGDHEGFSDWFVVRPAKEKLNKREKHVIETHSHIGREPSSCYGELKAVARVLYKHPNSPAQSPPYDMVLV